MPNPLRSRRVPAVAHRVKSVAVFCGSNSGVKPEYLHATEALARAIVSRGLAVVYGGAAVGLMGRLADTALAAGGRVVGVIPESLRQKEIAHLGLTELHVVDSMHTRKRMMADFADAFVALPGGIGTLEELCEVWTWAQLGHHDKPCGLLDVADYYASLTAFFDHGAREGFMREKHRAMLLVERDPERLLDGFEAYEAPVVSKWIGPEDL